MGMNAIVFKENLSETTCPSRAVALCFSAAVSESRFSISAPVIDTSSQVSASPTKSSGSKIVEGPSHTRSLGYLIVIEDLLSLAVWEACRVLVYSQVLSSKN